MGKGRWWNFLLLNKALISLMDTFRFMFSFYPANYIFYASGDTFTSEKFINVFHFLIKNLVTSSAKVHYLSVYVWNRGSLFTSTWNDQIPERQSWQEDFNVALFFLCKINEKKGLRGDSFSDSGIIKLVLIWFSTVTSKAAMCTRLHVSSLTPAATQLNRPLRWCTTCAAEQKSQVHISYKSFPSDVINPSCARPIFFPPFVRVAGDSLRDLATILFLESARDSGTKKHQRENIYIYIWEMRKD